MRDWQPFPPAPAPVERAVQARYWTLAKHARQAVCDGVAHPLGTEVTVSVNGELIRGEVARTPAQARTLADQWCAAFIDKDWSPSGPDRAPGAALRWTLHRRALDVLCESVPAPRAVRSRAVAAWPDDRAGDLPIRARCGGAGDRGAVAV